MVHGSKNCEYWASWGPTIVFSQKKYKILNPVTLTHNLWHLWKEGNSFDKYLEQARTRQIQTWAHPPFLGWIHQLQWHCQAACCQWRPQHFLTSFHFNPHTRWKVCRVKTSMKLWCKGSVTSRCLSSRSTWLAAAELFCLHKSPFMPRCCWFWGQTLESLVLGDSLSGWESRSRLRAWELCSRADIRLRTGWSWPWKVQVSQKCTNCIIQFPELKPEWVVKFCRNTTGD